MNDLNILYYDIESIPELFSVAVYYDTGMNLLCDVYYLLDRKAFPQKLTPQEENLIIEEIFKSNKNLDRRAVVRLFDMSETTPDRYGVVPVVALAALFGSPAGILNQDFPIVKDTDPGYDESKYPYIAGYNNLNYDMSMMAFYFSQVLMKGTKKPYNEITTETIREFNDELFHEEFKSYMPGRLRYEYLHGQSVPAGTKTVQIGAETLVDRGWNADLPYYQIYQYMVNTGRHLDIARLNEKQFRLALKRILGMLGYQIMEPQTSLNAMAAQDSHMTFDQLKNTLAYNVSDVVQLSHLMDHKAYKGPFLLKKQMLKDYPMTVYKQKTILEPYTYTDAYGNKCTGSRKKTLYEPDIRPDAVRKDRLTINASSAKLAAGSLCPYGELTDLDCVNFNYPHPDKAKERGVPVINVLNTLETFVNDRMMPKVKSAAGQKIIDSIREVISMYRQFEGKDFNSSHEDNRTYDKKEFARVINVIYMGPDGEPTTCFATFSIGGIHGAEYNKALYEKDMEDFRRSQELFAKIKTQYPDPVILAATVNEKGKPCRRKTFSIDGVEYQVKDFLKSGYTMTKAVWKPNLENAKPPELFPMKGRSKQKRELDKRYGYTSFGEANHEDFTSYYPRMLSQMMAFFNRLMGKDPYEEIFQNKSKFGKMMEDPAYTEVEQALFGNMRNGTKLVLNSASGAADTDHKTSIRMNNQIIKMRIVGQIYAFMIAQAQALEGAVVPSTNTDGIYTFMDEEKNNEILFREAAITGVEMEPERLYLISKDTNNRVEAKVIGNTGNLQDDVKILGASGGTLACFDGPNPEKSLDHPAIQDWLLVWNLLKNALQTNAIGPYDRDYGIYLLTQVAPGWKFMKKDCPDFSDRRRFLIMFQHILSSSPGMHYYTFASETPINALDQTIKPIPCQHHTRVFYVNPDKMPENEKHRIRYMATAYMMKLQKRDNWTWKTDEELAETNTPSYPAIRVIRDFNGDKEGIELKGKIAKIKKLKGLDTTQPCLIVNEDLDYAEVEPEWLDYECYNRIAESCYHKNWENTDSGHADSDDEEETEE